MTVRTKIILKLPLLWWRNHRARVLAKKIKKWKDGSRYPSQWRIKYVIKHTKKFLKMMKVKITVKGYENIIKAPALLTPNHASALDPLIILIALKNPSLVKSDHQIETVFLAKEELKKNRFRGYLNIINTFYLNRENPREALKKLDEFLDYAKVHQKLAVVFPEGTRSKDGKIQEFKAGAFRIAKQGFLPIIPVTINNSLGANNLSRRKWLDVQVIFHPAIKPIEFMALDTKSIGEKVQKIVTKDLKISDIQRSKFENKIA